MAGVQQNNRLASASYPDPSPMPSGPITVSYSNDSVGNCVSEGSERKYEWDHAGRLRSFRNQAADTSEPTQYVQYLYDAAGQRVKKLNRKQTGANWDAVVYIDGVLELRTQKRGATTKQGLELHVLDGQKRLGRRRSGDSFDSKPDNLLVLGDHLGSANVELDWSLGSFVDREEFRPYGETSFGSYVNKRYRFTGKERDEESGLNYHGERHYVPGLARWMSPELVANISISQEQYQAADQALRNRFQVIPDGFIGVRLPNNVTQQEYQQIVKLYAAIKTGQSSIRFGTEFADNDRQKNLEEVILRDLATIMQSKTGKDLVMKLAENTKGHKIVIGLSRDHDGRIVKVPGTQPLRTGPLAPNGLTYSANTHNGHGCDMIIGYSPGEEHVIAGGKEAWSRSRSDVSLIHELIHAYHGVYGTEAVGYVSDTMALSPFDRPTQSQSTDIADYQVIGLGNFCNERFTENKYRAELRLMEGNRNNPLTANREYYSVHTE